MWYYTFKYISIFLRYILILFNIGKQGKRQTSKANPSKKHSKINKTFAESFLLNSAWGNDAKWNKPVTEEQIQCAFSCVSYVKY